MKHTVVISYFMDADSVSRLLEQRECEQRSIDKHNPGMGITPVGVRRKADK